ncbi:MAG: galactose mutarotase, partial [Planctomycetaceae bacterium]|nr:galactose mutarotase [Planctomycetaceae bacterium]
PDGEEGYPAEVTTEVIYRLDGPKLQIEYHARSNHPTVINLTNHAYWNLSGRGAIEGHQLQLNADRYLEADDDVLVTGNILNVVGTPYDFRKEKCIGQDLPATGGGYDHCFVVNDWDETLRQAAVVTDPQSGRTMEVWTSEPGIQLYTANHFDGSSRSAGYGRHEAFCLECQHFPDSPNQEDFPSTALRPGDEYRQYTEHHFSVRES